MQITKLKTKILNKHKSNNQIQTKNKSTKFVKILQKLKVLVLKIRLIIIINQIFLIIIIITMNN